MASNFKIISKKNHTKLQLDLFGDFDANSAYEVLNMLNQSQMYSKVIINTDRLKSIGEFGQEVLRQNLKEISKSLVSIVLIGDKFNELSPET